jgi:outer membrane protein OmpA-like peptidoglycan-associated protein
VVKLLDKNENIIEETFTDDDGNFQFKVYSEEDYILIGEKENYFNTRGVFSTIGKSLDKSKLKEFITEVEFEKNLILDKIIMNKSIVLDNIYYDLNKSEIRPDAAKELDKLVIIMKDNPSISIELSSHTDDRSSVDYNQDLSQRRAESAVVYIIDKGINENRIIAKGYGESQLLITNAKNEEEHQINRRTEFKVTSYEFIERDEPGDDERFFNNN